MELRAAFRDIQCARTSLSKELRGGAESDQRGAACGGETLIINPNLLYFSVKVRHAQQPGRMLQTKEKESGVHGSLDRQEMVAKR